MSQDPPQAGVIAWFWALQAETGAAGDVAAVVAVAADGHTAGCSLCYLTGGAYLATTVEGGHHPYS